MCLQATNVPCSLVYFGIGRISSQNRPLGFGIAAVITLVAAFVVYKAINEPRDAIYYKSQAEETPWWKNIGSLLNKEHKDLWFMLLAIFLWFIAYNAVETFYVVYMSLESGMDPTVAENLAKLNLGVMSLVFMVFALPAGWLANKFGRKRVMSFGLVFMLLAVTGIMFTRNALWLNLLFAMAGVGWAMININSLPTVVDMALLLRLVRLPVCITFLPKLHQLFLRHLLALSPIWQKVNTSCSPMH